MPNLGFRGLSDYFPNYCQFFDMDILNSPGARAVETSKLRPLHKNTSL